MPNDMPKQLESPTLEEMLMFTEKWSWGSLEQVRTIVRTGVNLHATAAHPGRVPALPGDAERGARSALKLLTANRVSE